MSMNPLGCDSVETTRPSIAERVWMWIPFIGWLIAAAMHQARVRPMVDDVRSQLQARPCTAESWEGDSRRLALARRVRAIIAEEIGWPNDHFIEMDPTAILLWSHRDGLDGVAVWQSLEAECQIKLPVAEFGEWLERGTLGGLVDALLARMPESPPPLLSEEMRRLFERWKSPDHDAANAAMHHAPQAIADLMELLREFESRNPR